MSAWTMPALARSTSQSTRLGRRAPSTWRQPSSAATASPARPSSASMPPMAAASCSLLAAPPYATPDRSSAPSASAAAPASKTPPAQTPASKRWHPSWTRDEGRKARQERQDHDEPNLRTDQCKEDYTGDRRKHKDESQNDSQIVCGFARHIDRFTCARDADCAP